MDEQHENFFAARQRPSDYSARPPAQQWAIDRMLGIVDWEGSQTDEKWDRRPHQPFEQLELFDATTKTQHE